MSRTPENPYATADKIVTDYCRRLGFESLDDVGSLQHAIAAAIRAAEELAREESWCAGMAYAKSADPDCLQHLSGKVIDCTGPEPRVLPMAPRADGSPSTLPVTADGYVVGLDARMRYSDDDGNTYAIRENCIAAQTYAAAAARDGEGANP